MEKLRNSQEVLFNDKVIQSSPVLPQFKMVDKYDENGVKITVAEPEDYKAYHAEIGKYQDWTLDALTKAGINPSSMHVSTGYNTRLEGINDIQAVEADLDAFIANNPLEGEEIE